MDRDTYKKAFEKINVSKNCIEEVIYMSYMTDKKRKTVKFKWIVPAVIAVVMMSGITAAAYGLDIGNIFRSYFENDTLLSEKQLKLIDEARVELLATATDNGTTINVKAAVGDNNTAYILFDVIAPEGTVLGEENYVFESTSLVFNDIDGKGGMSLSIAALKDDILTDNKKSFMGEIHAANMDLQNRDISLSLQNLPVKFGKPENEAVIEGNWNLEFKLDYNTESKRFEVNKSHNFDSINAIIAAIEISSVSASVEFKEGTTSIDGDMNDYCDLIPNLTVNFNDGTSFTADNGPGVVSDNVLIQNYSFGTPIDISSVKSITLGDLEIPIE